MKSRKRILAWLSALVLMTALLPTSAVHAADENLMAWAAVTTDIPCQTEEEGVQQLYDGKTNTPLVSDSAALKFPYHIELDFGGYQAVLSDLKLYSLLGTEMGVTNLTVERYEKGQWRPVQSGIMLKWDRADGANAELRTVHFSTPARAEKFRITINEANTKADKFRIDELEFVGRLTGLAQKEEVKAVKSNYVKAAAGEEILLPKQVTAATPDGTIALNVDWHSVDAAQERLYAVGGSIPFYDIAPQTVLDVYDPGKMDAALEGHWAAGLVKDAVRDGLFGSIEIAPDRGLTFYDAALIFYRFAELAPVMTTPKDQAEHNPGGELVRAAVENGVFTGVVSNTFPYENSLSRMDAVRCILNLEAAALKAVSTSGEPSFEDMGHLNTEELGCLKRAVAIGVVSDAKQFRPDDTVTVAEMAAMLSKLASGGQAGEDGMLTRTFADSGEVLVNPYMGIFSYYLDNGLVNYDIHYENDEYFEDVPGLSNLYIRIPWSVAEPEKGVYDFSIVDGVIEKFKRVGKQISLRFTASETGHVYATPKWVFDEGAKVHWWGYDGKNDSYTMPYFDDEIFLKNLDVFLGEVAKRYDGNPNIAYIDVGSLGIWGEGHTGSAGYTLTPAAARKHLELHHKHFKKTKVVVLDDMGQNFNDRFFPEIKDDVIAMGFGLRNDGYAGVDGKMRFIREDDKTLGDGIWEQAPIIIEPEHYNEMKRLDIWGNGVDLAHWIDTVHATYIGLHGFSKVMAEENPEFMEYANKRIGYRILPETVRLTSEARVHGSLQLKADWKNIAAAPCYNGAYPAVTLKDADGTVMSVMVDSSFNIKDLPVADPGKAQAVTQEASFRLHDVLPGGTYQAFLSLGSLTGSPEIKMPITGEDGEGRYYIGDVKVKGDYDLSVSGQTADGSVTLHFEISPEAGEYSNLWGNIALREQGQKQVYMPGDILIGVDTAPLKEAIRKKQACDITVKLELPDAYQGKPLADKSVLKGRQFDVYFDMDTLAEGMTPGMLLSGNGRSPKIGTAVISDDLKIIFEPLK